MAEEINTVAILCMDAVFTSACECRDADDIQAPPAAPVAVHAAGAAQVDKTFEFDG
jgi:hypothetical protein